MWSNFEYFMENASKERMAKNLALVDFPEVENAAKAEEAEKKYMEMTEEALRELCYDRFNPGA